MKWIWAVVTLICLAGGGIWLGFNIAANARLSVTVRAFSAEADQCLYDVRDRRLTYARSHHCAKLGELARAYIEAGGGSRDTAARHELVFAEGRVSAWTALALSEGGSSSLNIW